jgi:TP901 family phage tail tape measure protein
MGRASGAFLNLGLVAQGLPGPLGQVAGAFGMLAVEIDHSQLSMLAITAGMGAMAAAGVAAINEVTHRAADFESALANVRVVSAATDTQMAQLQSRAMQLGVATAYSSTQIAQGFYELSSAGLTVNESLTAIEPITKAAMLANRDLGDQTKDTVNVMRQWGLEATDIQHIVDVQSVAVQGSTLHWNEIGEVYRNIAGRAHTMGVGLEEATAGLMLTTNAGLSASMAGTALGTFMDRLAKNTGEAAEGARELGLSLYDEKGQFVGLTAVLEQIETKLPTMTQQQINHAESFLSGARASGFLRNALSQTQTVMIDGNEVVLKGTQLMRYWEDQLKNSGGTVARQADIVFGTWNLQMKIFNASVQEAQITLGQQFLPALERVTPVLTGVVNAFILMPAPVKAGLAAILAISTALAGTVASVALLGTVGAPVWAALAEGGAATAAAMGLAGVSLGAAAVAVGVLGIAVAALAAAWASDFDGLRTSTTDAVQNGIIPATQDAQSAIAAIIRYLQETGIPAWIRYWNRARGLDDEGNPLTPGNNMLPPEQQAEAEANQPPRFNNVGDFFNAQRAGLQQTFGIVNSAPQDVADLARSGFAAAGGRGLQEDQAVQDQLNDPAIQQRFQALVAMEQTHGQAARKAFDEGYVQGEGQIDVAGEQSQYFAQEYAALQPLLAQKGTDAAGALLNAFRSGLSTGQQNDLDALIGEYAARLPGAIAQAQALQGSLIAQGAPVEDARVAGQALLEAEYGQPFTDALRQRWGNINDTTIALIKQATLNAAAAARQAAQDEESANARGDQGQAVALASSRLLAESGGNLSKAIGTAEGGGNQLAATDLIAMRNQLQLITTATKDFSAAQEAEVQVMLHAKGVGHEHEDVLHTLEFLYKSGEISLEAYNAVLNGEAAGHGKAQSAAQKHREALQAMVQGTDETQIAAGLLEQRIETLATKIGADMPTAVQASITRLINLGDTMGAARLAGDQLHLSMETITAAANGDQAAIQQVNEAMRAYTGTQGQHKQSTDAVKNSYQELLKSTDATKVAQGLLQQSTQGVIDTYAKQLPQLQANFTALRNANDQTAEVTLLATQLGVSEDTVTQAAAGSSKAIAELDLATARLNVSQGAGVIGTRAYAQALQALGQSTDAGEVAAGLYGQQLEKVENQALQGMNIATRSVVQATLNAGDQFKATQQIADYYGVSVDTVRRALEGQTEAENKLTEAIKRKADAQRQASSLPPLPAGITLLPGDQRLAPMIGTGPATTTTLTGPLNPGAPVGAGIAEGLAAGITGGQSDVVAATVGVVTASMNAARDYLQIASPSQRWAELGQQSMAGLAQGITDGRATVINSVSTALADISDRAAAALQTGLSDVLNQEQVKLDTTGAKKPAPPGVDEAPPVLLEGLDVGKSGDVLANKMDRIYQTMQDQGSPEDAIYKTLYQFVNGPAIRPPTSDEVPPPTTEPIPYGDPYTYGSVQSAGSILAQASGVVSDLVAGLGSERLLSLSDLGTALDQRAGTGPFPYPGPTFGAGMGAPNPPNTGTTVTTDPGDPRRNIPATVTTTRQETSSSAWQTQGPNYLPPPGWSVSSARAWYASQGMVPPAELAAQVIDEVVTQWTTVRNARFGDLISQSSTASMHQRLETEQEIANRLQPDWGRYGPQSPQTIAAQAADNARRDRQNQIEREQQQNIIQQFGVSGGPYAGTMNFPPATPENPYYGQIQAANQQRAQEAAARQAAIAASQAQWDEQHAQYLAEQQAGAELVAQQRADAQAAQEEMFRQQDQARQDWWTSLPEGQPIQLNEIMAAQAYGRHDLVPTQFQDQLTGGVDSRALSAAIGQQFTSALQDAGYYRPGVGIMRPDFTPEDLLKPSGSTEQTRADAEQSMRDAVAYLLRTAPPATQQLGDLTQLGQPLATGYTTGTSRYLSQVNDAYPGMLDEIRAAQGLSQAIPTGPVSLMDSIAAANERDRAVAAAAPTPINLGTQQNNAFLSDLTSTLQGAQVSVSSLTGKITTSTDGIQRAMERTAQAGGGLVTTVTDGLGQAATTVRRFPETFDQVSAVIQRWPPSLQEPLSAITGSIQSVADQTGQTFRQALNDLTVCTDETGQISGIFDSMGNDLSAQFTGIDGTITGGANALSAAMDGLKGLPNLLKSPIQGLAAAYGVPFVGNSLFSLPQITAPQYGGAGGGGFGWTGGVGAAGMYGSNPSAGMYSDWMLAGLGQPTPLIQSQQLAEMIAYGQGNVENPTQPGLDIFGGSGIGGALSKIPDAPGSVVVGQSGSGLATANVYDDPSNPQGPHRGGTTIQDEQEMQARQQAGLTAQAKALVDNVSYAALAWSAIQQQSVVFGSQFAAYQAKTLDSAAQVSNAVGSVAGSYIQTVAGASGGLASGPRSVQNGATGPSALDALLANIRGQVGTLGPDLGATAGVVADQMNQSGRYADALAAAQLEQDQANNEVKRLQSLLDGYGGHLESAGDVISALAAAQQRAITATDHFTSVQTDITNKTVTQTGPTANPIDLWNAAHPDVFKPPVSTVPTGGGGFAGGFTVDPVTGEIHPTPPPPAPPPAATTTTPTTTTGTTAAASNASGILLGGAQEYFGATLATVPANYQSVGDGIYYDAATGIFVNPNTGAYVKAAPNASSAMSNYGVPFTAATLDQMKAFLGVGLHQTPALPPTTTGTPTGTPTTPTTPTAPVLGPNGGIPPSEVVPQPVHAPIFPVGPTEANPVSTTTDTLVSTIPSLGLSGGPAPATTGRTSATIAAAALAQVHLHAHVDAPTGSNLTDLQLQETARRMLPYLESLKRDLGIG